MASPNHSQEITIPARSLGPSVETPFGTDFSLELSGALESDAHDHLSGKETQMDDFASIVMLDPEVLASLIIQLRTNLSSATRERDLLRGERDELIRDLVITQTRLQDLEGSQEREVQLLNEMASWRKRAEDAEEQVAMLRGKVEESRRAVMTLQTQSRRLSQLTSASPHASPLAQTFGTVSAGSDGNTLRSPFQKRMSLQPAAPGATPSPNPRRGHRRERSLTDITSSVTSGESESTESSAQEHGASPPRPPSRRQSTAAHTRPTESLLNPYAAEMESLRQELISVRMELIEAKQEAWEASEAKEASDVCLKALKEFIAENSIGDGAAKADATGEATSLRGLSLPPLPTDRIDDEEGIETPVATHAHSASVSSRKGWGLGFWSSAPTPAAPSSEPAPPVVSSASSGTPVVSPSSQSQATCTKSPPPPPPAQSAGAFSSFVSRWKRTDSTTSPPAPVTPAVSTSIASAFRWSQASSSSSSTSPNASAENDSYTPAPKPGNLKRRPSAYSVMTTSTKSEMSDRDSVRKETLFSYDNTQDSMLSTIPLDAIGEKNLASRNDLFATRNLVGGRQLNIDTFTD